jgi:hypothetical protein
VGADVIRQWSATAVALARGVPLAADLPEQALSAFDEMIGADELAARRKHADCPRAFECHFVNRRLGNEFQVRALSYCWGEVGVRGGCRLPGAGSRAGLRRRPSWGCRPRRIAGTPRSATVAPTQDDPPVTLAELGIGMVPPSSLVPCAGMDSAET